jgi:hypothetical protein
VLRVDIPAAGALDPLTETLTLLDGTALAIETYRRGP